LGKKRNQPRKAKITLNYKKALDAIMLLGLFVCEAWIPFARLSVCPAPLPLPCPASSNRVTSPHPLTCASESV
ncbi:MAG: hypothetical protein U9O54_03715, partial [Chloroflexota bacterium]|nr:hypothetical protein [Chloroflexota bacterium]